MFTKIIDGKLIEKAEKFIDAGQRFVLTCHEHPDGDALGSLLAMSAFLRQLGKTEVWPVVPDRIPENLRWLPGTERVKVFSDESDVCLPLIASADVLIFLDFNEVSRTGRQLAEALRASAAVKIMLDHHPYPADDARLIISQPEMCATAEVVFRYICRTGNAGLIDYDMAECIYAGLMTDTGNFSYNSNRRDIYFIIGELLDRGIDKDALYRKVYAVNSIGRTRMQGYLMDRGMEILPEYHTAVMTLSDEDFKRFGCDASETDGLVNLPLAVRDIVLSVFLREDGGLVRVSLRSTGDFPANELAAALYNGGGHLNAAGGRYEGTLAEGVQRLKEALPGYFNKQFPKEQTTDTIGKTTP